MPNQVFMFPTTFAQQQLWLVDQITPGSTVNNIPIAVRLRGPLSIPILENALNEVVRRHESLRTTFVTVDGQPMQIVAPELRVRISVVELRVEPIDSNETVIQERVQEDAGHPFDLINGPLFRTILLAFSDSYHVLILTMHHLISDGWSVDILNRELSALYDAFRAGDPSPLSELPIQYPDFAIWQRSWLAGETLDKQLAYWKRKLAGAPPVLELPTDRPRPAAQSFRGARVSHQLPESLTDAIRALSRREGTTLFMTLLAGFQALLQRYSHQNDILVGTPVANRTRTETEGMIGLFVNTLVMRTDLSGDPSFRELLRRVRETSLGSFAHQDMPFEKLVEEMAPERRLSHTPLFQVMFVLQNAQTTRKPFRSVPAAGVPSQKLKLKGMPIDSGAAKFDLTLSVIDTKSSLLATLTYSVDLFEEGTAQRMLGHLEMMLEAATAEPSQPLSSLPLLTALESNQLLHEWNQTNRTWPLASPPIHRWFEEQAELNPDTIAVSCENARLSYRNLNCHANQLAHYLVKIGVKPDRRIALCVERSVELIVGLLAILKAGGAYVPLDPTYPKERLAYMIGDADAGIVITQESLLSTIPADAAQVICIDSDWESIEVQNASNLPDIAGPENLAYVMYTSGSTGRPKGVMVEHRQLLSYTLGVMERLEIEPKWSYAMVQPLTVDSSITMIYPALCTGGHLHVITNDRARDSYGLSSYFQENLIDCLKIAPSHLAALHIFPQPEQLMPRKRLVLGGEASHWDWARGLQYLVPGCRVFNHYGPTETTVGVMVFPFEAVSRERQLLMTPLGRPLPGAKIYLLDQHLRPVPVGVPGELYIGGAYVTRGYLKLPELTAEKFVSDPFSAEPSSRLYRTGDTARYLPEGDVEFLGRSDDQVKIRGYRIELQEIEVAIVRHPNIRETVVLGREDTPGNKRLVAYVTSKTQPSPSPADLRSFLSDHLPGHMVPSVYVALSELPRTTHGKIDRRALPVPERAQSEPIEAYAPPRNKVEEILARIWAQVLRLERVSIHDNFFELGGDSILSIQIMARCNQAGLCFTAKQLFEHQTIAKLAPVVGNTVPVNAEQGLTCGTAPLTPIQRRFFERDPPEPDHFNQAFLLEIRRALDPTLLREVIAALIMHHDALRIRFANEDGLWSQTHAEFDGSEVFTGVDLSSLTPIEQQRSMRDFAFDVQRSLDLTHGPVARVVFFDCGSQKLPRLLIVIHHLVVDSASWSILLEDLERACNQRSRGEPIQLPQKTTSFQHWAKRLESNAHSADLLRELPYWLAEPPNWAAALPRDFSNAPEVNTVKSMRTVSISLSVHRTRALLQDVPRTYRTQINDVLLTAVLQGFVSWTGARSLPITLDSHGREAIFDDCDLSRTVGRFTSVFPATLDLGDVNDIGAALKSVKEQLRRIPKRGIGYGVLRYLADDETRSRLAARPAAEVSFSYLGQLDPVLSDGSQFSLVPEKVGSKRSSQFCRYHLIEIGAKLLSGRLRLAFTFSSKFHRRSTIERLARDVSQYLQAIVMHCQNSEGGWHTASDFPLAKLEPDLFQRLFGEDRNIWQMYPLSPLQQGMLFHSLYALGSDVYIGQRLRKLSRLNVGAFQRAWRRVVDRHPVLRTAFVWKNLDQPLQIIRREVDIEWKELDWQHLASDEQASAFAEYQTEDRRKGFDLAQAPLMRLALIRLGPSTYQFLWSNHQLLLDGWSTTLIVREVAAFYEAFSQGHNLHLRRPRPYKEFIAWLQTRNLAAAETFWRRQLTGFSTPTALRSDQPRPRSSAAQEYYHGQSVQLPTIITGKLQDLTRRCRVTLNTVIQAAWAVLLSQYSGDQDVVFGAVVSGRPPELKGVEGMIGLFINTLPVRVDVMPEVPLAVWLERLQSQQVEAREFEYASLLQIQGWSEVVRGLPLFESILIFENHPTASSPRTRGGSGIQQIRATERTNYPLNVIVVPGEALVLKILYDSTRFRASAIKRMLSHLQTILAAMSNNVERLVGSLPLLSVAERRQTVVDWNKTGRSWPLDRPIHTWFEEQVDRTPDTVAISRGAEQVTFRELNRRANRLARHLRELGVFEEQLVAVCLERSIDAVVALLAVLKAGGAYVPLDPGYPIERLAFMLKDSRAAVLITSKSLRDIFPVTSSSILCVDSDASAIQKHSPKNLAPTLGGGKLAYVIYTSGSTGRPKGVLATHAGAVNRFFWMWEAYPFEPDEVCCQKTALSFVDSIWEIFGPLLKGVRLVIIPDEVLLDPHALIRSLEHHSVTRIVLVPSLLRAILDSDFDIPRRLARLRICVSSGESLSQELVQRFQEILPAAILLNLYGSSEVSADVTFYDTRTYSEEFGSIPIGRPIANIRTYVLDQSLRPVPVGVPGELYVAGVGVARGYLGRQELTSEKFIQNPFSGKPGETMFRTGDMARYSEDGVIEYLGRRDRQIKIRGFRVELDEIEAVLAQHPDVLAAVVVDRRNRLGDRYLVGYVVPANGTQIPDWKLREFLQKRLPDYMVPSALGYLDRLPLTPNGKIDRAALPSDVGQADHAETYISPRTPTETTVAALWTQLLGVEKVGVYDGFFALGGHSLLAMQLISRIRDAFQVELPLRVVFQDSTVGGLADAITRLKDRTGEIGPEVIVPVLREQFVFHLTADAAIEAEAADSVRQGV
jgi:amino acid adenylation domain-containing protein/non-ribosomal peptide synthase protein (TIGR01720 family)